DWECHVQYNKNVFIVCQKMKPVQVKLPSLTRDGTVGTYSGSFAILDGKVAGQFILLSCHTLHIKNDRTRRT
ncbi:unnamed protein product, partial [Ilex paraguariensis]